jgi:Flavodoxin reductases (ferredoxin-NADPH reductases) family 1
MDTSVTVTSVSNVGSDTAAIRFEAPDDFEARPGQFVKLGGTVDGEEYDRFYTLSSPDVQPEFETTVEADPGESGPFASHLVSLEPGETVRMDGPFGADFYENEQRVLLLASGPGVGPAVAIAERALADGNEAAVLYRSDSPVHADRLDELRDSGVTVEVTADPIASNLDGLHTGDAGEQIFAYGFEDFVDEARAAIETVGGDPDAAKIENFG